MSTEPQDVNPLEGNIQLNGIVERLGILEQNVTLVHNAVFKVTSVILGCRPHVEAEEVTEKETKPLDSLINRVNKAIDELSSLTRESYDELLRFFD